MNAYETAQAWNITGTDAEIVVALQATGVTVRKIDLAYVGLAQFVPQFLLVLVTAILLFRRWKSTKQGRYAFDRFKLAAPIFGLGLQYTGMGQHIPASPEALGLALAGQTGMHHQQAFWRQTIQPAFVGRHRSRPGPGSSGPGFALRLRRTRGRRWQNCC